MLWAVRFATSPGSTHRPGYTLIQVFQILIIAAIQFS